MDEVYIRTDDLARWVKENYFDNRDFITIDEFYRAFEQLSSDYEVLEEKLDDLKNNNEDYYENTI